MKKILCIAVALSLTGCATPYGKEYQPIVDMKGQDRTRYEANLRECQEYAGGLSAGRSLAAGAVIGALLGFAIGAPLGLGGKFNANIAGFGAAAGGASAAGRTINKQETIIMRCLQGRGYNVLN